MKVTSERRDGQVILTVEVEGERVEKAKDQAYRRLASRHAIPGFRKGKAPRAMVERYVGPATLLDEALQQLVPVVFREAIDAEQIKPIAEPEVSIVGYEPVTIKAVVSVPPTVALGDYRAIRVTPEPAVVMPEQVDETIERLRNQSAAWEPVERPVELGDSLTLDLKGTRDGEPFTDETDVPCSVTAENRFPVPGFAEQLVGAEINQPKEIDLTFPADYDDERLAGKSYHFTATVHEVKARQLPALDDTFARSLGEGLETVEQLRARVEKNLQTRAEAEARAQVERGVLDQLVAASQIEFPPIMVDHRVHQEMEDRSRSLAQYKITLEQWLKIQSKTVQQYHDELEEPTREALRRDLALQELARVEGIVGTTDETRATLRRVMRNSSPDELEQMLETEQIRDAIADTVVRQKALRWLVGIATEGQITYPPMDEEPATGESVPSALAESEAAGEPTIDAPAATPAAAEGLATSEEAEQAQTRQVAGE